MIGSMTRILTFLLCLLPALAHAQGGPVQQSGPVTPGHIPVWATNGVVQDGGPATNGTVSNIGLLGSGLPLCINDVPAGSVGGWHQLCLGANASGGGLLSYQALGGATPLPLQCNVNGVTADCGASGGPPGGANTQVQFNSAGVFGGDLTFAFDSTTKAVTIGGPSSNGIGLTVGSALANYLTLSGNSSTPVIAAAGTGNVFLQIQGLGTRGPLLSTGNGNVIETLSAAGSIGNFLIVTSEALGNPVQISTSDVTDHAGLQLLNFTQVQHNFAYAGTAASAANQNFSAVSTISGTSNDSSQFAINNIAVTATNTTSFPMAALAVTFNQNAGFYGPSNGIAVYDDGFGAPGTVPLWAPSQSNTTLGALVQNGPYVYRLKQVGTSAAAVATFTCSISAGTMTVSGVTGTIATNQGVQGTNVVGGTYITAGGGGSSWPVVPITETAASGPCTSGGPAGTGSNVSDGAAIWAFTNSADQSWYHTVIGTQEILNYNVGGTATDPRGFAFGGGFGVYMHCPGSAPNCATNFNNVIGTEIDAFMDTGTSTQRRAVLQVVGGNRGSQAYWQDWGVIITSTQTAGAGLLNPLILSNNDANSYGMAFWDQGASGGYQHMAGGVDMMRVAADGSGPSGGGFLMRWPNGALTNPTGEFAGGSLQLGGASLAPSSTGLTIDVPLYGLSSGTPSIVSGGTGWTASEWATDGYGNWGQATTVVAGVVTVLTVRVLGQAPSAHNGTVTWTPDSSGPPTEGGGNSVPTTFTVTEAWSQISSPSITLGGTADLIIGNLGSGTATKYVCTTSTNHIVVQAGAC